MRILLTLLLCGSAFGLRADINGDGRVDLLDLSILAEEWLMEEPDMLGENILVNSDFAESLDGWTASNGGIVWNAAGFAEVNFVGEFGEHFPFVQPVTLEVGKTYRLSTDVLVDEFAIMAKDFVFTGTGVGIRPDGLTVGKAWVEFIATQASQSVGVEFISGGFSGAVYQFDNLLLQEVVSANKNNSFGPWRFGCE
ncbi:MAG: hypothetical protein LLF76_02265 [Planctomycetaceae bacterium]|nr:hypothetical protein [Planctomycetaceae bacterium]